MKRLKLRVSAICIICLSIIMTSICFANELSFNRKFVDSNQYTTIGSATKSANGTYGEIKVQTIYNANLVDSGYQQVYAKVLNGSAVLITRGSWYTVPIPSAYQHAGSNVLLKCKGHNPALDCYITGYWNVH